MKRAGALLFCTALVVLLLYSCKKTPVVPIDFSTSTVTDAACNVISADSTDWGFDSTFTPQVKAFFRFIDTSVVISDTQMGTIWVSPICPNPSNGQFAMNVFANRECKFKAVCVNEEMQVLYYHTIRIPRGIYYKKYDFSSQTSFRRNGHYRMYYAFYNAKDSMYYKGHGDFRIE